MGALVTAHRERDLATEVMDLLIAHIVKDHRKVDDKNCRVSSD